MEAALDQRRGFGELRERCLAAAERAHFVRRMGGRRLDEECAISAERDPGNTRRNERDPRQHVRGQLMK